jgi:hypothetical protein
MKITIIKIPKAFITVKKVKPPFGCGVGVTI